MDSLLSNDENLKFGSLMASHGDLLHKGLQWERECIVNEAGMIIFSDKSTDSKQQEFAELNERARHIDWTAKWLDSFGKVEAAADH